MLTGKKLRRNEFVIHGDTATMFVNVRNGDHFDKIHVKVSSSDIDQILSVGKRWVRGLRTYSCGKKRRRDVPYIQVSIRRGDRYENILLHRFLMNPPDGMVVDHINGDTMDNRRENLRIVTISENLLNNSKRRQSCMEIKNPLPEQHRANLTDEEKRDVEQSKDRCSYREVRPDPQWVRGRCPECGDDLVSNLYYVGGKGYILVWECWSFLAPKPTCNYRKVL